MSEKPILFNTEMVLAILDGHKTQTRRVVKPQFGDVRTDGVPKERWDLFISPLTGWIYYGDILRQLTVDGKPVRAPVRPRDILYVRESWIENNNPNSENCGGYEYRADYNGALCQSLIKWRPSIHMPKKAARIFLRVTDVRVERLKSISANDAMSEGFTDWNDLVRVWDGTVKTTDRDRYGWDANPWVWVICFEKIDKEDVECND